ncbi:hypothetical protein KC19_1G272100 [Ceratodon purpureus]|uniref:Uncharacterized protein n=1 Tax=Ceratodon purpureus TaxID=3225 RepID=A0A8T0JA95_CERPU|nr:hypothetical protein KC19_1G272100 [Ceratodon purpureus]
MNSKNSPKWKADDHTKSAYTHKFPPHLRGNESSKQPVQVPAGNYSLWRRFESQASRIFKTQELMGIDLHSRVCDTPMMLCRLVARVRVCKLGKRNVNFPTVSS